MRVGFFLNQLDNRGTGNAVYDYALYNESLLGNESVIYTLRGSTHHPFSVNRFQQRFQVKVDPHPLMDEVDVLYHIKSGGNDGLHFPRTRYAVHAVFDGSQPHGDRYAAISPWLGRRNMIPYVPHIVTLPEHRESMRPELGIPADALVFGRHGAQDTFDIPWAWEAVAEAAARMPNAYFLFASTNRPDMLLSANILFIPELLGAVDKRRFINTCDAMIHARSRGETFGISVAEFAYCGKPVLTYAFSPEQAHIEFLSETQGNHFLYTSEPHLVQMLVRYSGEQVVPYKAFTPDVVMEKFKAVFLD